VLRGRRDECEFLDRPAKVERGGESRMLVPDEQRAATGGGWPLNLLSAHDAAEQPPILQAVATADLPHRVFPAEVRNVPAVMRPVPTPPPST
jgi:hypothetical protein